MARLKLIWAKVPKKTRQAIVLLIGLALVLVAGLVGTLPGPGGIPIFLLGVAILGTEFQWARRFGDWVLKMLELTVDFLKRHRPLAALFGLIVLLWLGYVIWLIFSRLA